MLKRRVIKVGGSLLDLPDLANRIQSWIGLQDPAQNILLMGGGNLCNEIRNLHQRFGFSEIQSHYCCLESMGVTATILGSLLTLQTVDCVREIRQRKGDVVFDCRCWIEQKTDLPTSWELTSDSISALLARELNAELVLFRSVSSREGVDDYFPQASDSLEGISWVNLREFNG
ncbi:MAG: hypothetical protein VX438_00385 [Planctomycetota bacterium]|nr:hypothetical protein [Planctomycetota bacterium]